MIDAIPTPTPHNPTADPEGAQPSPVYRFPLIHGVFHPSEAREILLSMIAKKIAFHELRTFSEVERFGSETSNSKKRIEELSALQESMKSIVQEVQRDGADLLVDAMIVIRRAPGTSKGAR